MKKIRWGVLSTAHIAQQQLIPAIFRAENAEVRAISSRSDKVHGIAAALNIPKAYESYDELLADPEIDAVYIPLPNHLHREWVFKAARQGKHILCEKPVSLTAETAAEMVSICRENNVKFMEAFMYQFHPQHKRVQEIIASGEIGEVKLMKSCHTFYLGQREGNIRMDKEMGGGSFYDVGCYSVHAMRYILQSEPVEVQVIADVDPVTGVDLSAFGYAKLNNGATVTFDSSFEMAERDDYEIVGTKGTIKVPHAFRPDKNGGIGQVIVQINGITREEAVPGDLYKLEVEHFSQCILDNKEPSYSPELMILNMRVIEACQESIYSGRMVEINE